MSDAGWRSVKYVWAAAAIGLAAHVYRKAHGCIRLPRGPFGPAGLIALLVIGSPGYLQAESGAAAAEATIDVLFGFLFAWAGFWVASTGRDQLDRALATAAIVMSAGVLVQLAQWYSGHPDWRSPFRPELQLYQTGFGAGRTGWSNAIALLLPGVYFLRRGTTYLPAVLGLLLLSGCVACAGRAGIVVATAGLAAGAWTRSTRRWFVISIVSALSILAAVVAFSPETLRLERLEGGWDSYNIDAWSAGRTTGYAVALEMLIERPALGYGVDQVDLRDHGFIYADVHNVWLRTGLEFGVAYPLSFLLLIVLLLVRRMRTLLHTQRSRERGLPIVTVGAGVALSMFEPNILIGSFQVSAVWWFCCGILSAQTPDSVLKPKPDHGGRLGSPGRLTQHPRVIFASPGDQVSGAGHAR